MMNKEQSASDRFDEAEDDDDAMDTGAPDAFAYDLGSDHYIRFKRRGTALLVSFETETGEILLADRVSRFADLAEEMQWSTLALTSRGDTWFRAPEVISFFDAMADGTLLDQFSDVLFYGQGTGGHAALTFSLTVPGARIIALAPHGGAADQAPPPPEGLDLTSRYGLNKAALVGAEALWLLYDPNVAGDRAQVSRIATPHTTQLRCRNMGPDIETSLNGLALLDETVVRAMAGTLEPTGFYRALRVRRDDPAALRRLIARLIAEKRPVLEALAVRNVAHRTGRQRFAKRFDQIEADLASRGIRVPPLREGKGS